MSFVIATYFCEWSIYKRKYFPWNIPAKNLTHLFYAFGRVDRDTGRLKMSSAFTDNIFKTASAEGKVYGLCEKIGDLKKENTHLKVLLSVGGGGASSEYLGEVMADAAKRDELIRGCVDMVANYGFDGIDLDWEYPSTPDDAIHLGVFMNDLRKQVGENAIISMAINAALFRIKALGISAFIDNINFVNIMGYDYAGPWVKASGYHSNLYNGRKSSVPAIDLLVSLGVPRRKIVLGVPFYGRAFANTDGLNSEWEGTVMGTWEDNIFDYNKLPLEGSVEEYDECHVAAHCYHKEKRLLVTYDNPRSIAEKCRFIKDNELGGIMSWSINGDAPTGTDRCLTDVMQKELGTSF